MINQEEIRQNLFNLLVSKDFDIKVRDINGKEIIDPKKAELFSFDFKVDSTQYGSVVITMDREDGVEVYYGDSLGRGMEEGDRSIWYDFLYQLRMFAKRNMLGFNLRSLSKLKYSMQSMANINEGRYYGSKKTSYLDQPLKTKLIIKHSKDLNETDARYRNIASLYVENSQGERFKLPFTKLVGGKAMARHVAEGGNPYDSFGQHICEIISDMEVLSKFSRSVGLKEWSEASGEIVESALRHYAGLKKKIKSIISRKSYHEYRDNFSTESYQEDSTVVDDLREMFTERLLDSRIEAAIPVLAKLKNQKSCVAKEINEFERWAESVTEGTWAVPKTPGDVKKLRDFLSREQPVGPDALDATSQLYDILGDDELFDRLGDLAQNQPEADARTIVSDWIVDHQFDSQWQDILRPLVVELGLDDQEQNINIHLPKSQ